MIRLWFRFVIWFNRKAKSLAIRLVRWTGKSKENIHPKHLIETDSHYWFLSFLSSDVTVLDLGCGNGAHTLKAAEQARQVKGIDQSADNLRAAQNLARDHHINNVAFGQCNLENSLDEPSHYYSAVLALDVLEHLNNRDQFLRETKRVLAVDGRLFLSVPNSETTWKRKLKNKGLFYYSDLDHKHEYTRTEMEELLDQHGYRIVHIEPVVYDTPWVGLMDVVGGISLTWYERLSKWKRRVALNHPAESTGFRVVAVPSDGVDR